MIRRYCVQVLLGVFFIRFYLTLIIKKIYEFYFILSKTLKKNFRHIIHLLHDGDGDMKIYFPRENYTFRGQRPRKYMIFWGNEYLYLHNVLAINCLSCRTTGDNI